MQEQTCRVPVEATYRMIDGQPVMVDAVWADVPASIIAKMLIRHYGKDAIFYGGEGETVD